MSKTKYTHPYTIVSVCTDVIVPKKGTTVTERPAADALIGSIN